MAHSSESDPDADPRDATLPSFKLRVVPADKASRLRLEHGGLRPIIVDTIPNSFEISCQCLDAVHGRLAPDSDQFASIIVIHMRFDSLKESSKISRVSVTFEFRSKRDTPEVTKITLDGNFSLAPSLGENVVVTDANLTVGLPESVAPLAFRVGRQRMLKTQVEGYIKVIGRKWLPEPRNKATWTLLENDVAQDGIPEAVRVAILLVRDSSDPFECAATVNADVSFWDSVKGIFTRSIYDEPVTFYPEKLSTHNLKDYNEEDLGKTELGDLFDISHRTVFLNAIKKV